MFKLSFQIITFYAKFCIITLCISSDMFQQIRIDHSLTPAGTQRSKDVP